MRKKFSEVFLKYPISRTVPKNVKGGTLWDFLNIHSVVKLKREPLKTFEKFAKKVSQSRNTMHKKFSSRARLEPMSCCVADLKNPNQPVCKVPVEVAV